MNETFLSALEKVGNATQKEIVRAIFEIFTGIRAMSLDEIIVAYQTYLFFRDTIDNSQEPVIRERLDCLSRAITGQMFTICSSPRDREERARIVRVIVHSVNDAILIHMILRDAIDGPRPPRKA